jgi:hypothetical protein
MTSGTIAKTTSPGSIRRRAGERLTGVSRRQRTGS